MMKEQDTPVLIYYQYYVLLKDNVNVFDLLQMD